MSNIKQAIQNEEIDKLNTLLTVFQCTQDYSQYLFLAITHIKPKATKALFKHCQFSFTNVTNEHGDHPLKTAIYTYKNAKENKKAYALSIVDLAIKYSDNIDIQDQWHNTPLMTAAYENIPQAVTLLLRANADYTITDDTGNNAIDKALWAEHQNVVIEFFKHNETLKNTPILFRGQTVLTKMVYGKNPPMVKFLLAQNVDVDAPSEDGMTPKEIAAEQGNQEIIGLLEAHNNNEDL